MSIYDQYPKLLEADFVESYTFYDCWTVLNPEGAYNTLDVAVALLQSDGNFSATAKLLQRPRRSVETFVQRTLELRELHEDTEESFLDAVEYSYRATAKGGDPGAQRFFLTTKAKDRGYVTRNESTGKNGNPIEVDEINARTTLSDRVNAILTARGKVSPPPTAVGEGSGGPALGLEDLGATGTAATD